MTWQHPQAITQAKSTQLLRMLGRTQRSYQHINQGNTKSVGSETWTDSKARAQEGYDKAFRLFPSYALSSATLTGTPAWRTHWIAQTHHKFVMREILAISFYTICLCSTFVPQKVARPCKINQRIRIPDSHKSAKWVTSACSVRLSPIFPAVPPTFPLNIQQGLQSTQSSVLWRYSFGDALRAVPSATFHLPHYLMHALHSPHYVFPHYLSFGASPLHTTGRGQDKWQKLDQISHRCILVLPRKRIMNHFQLQLSIVSSRHSKFRLWSFDYSYLKVQWHFNYLQSKLEVPTFSKRYSYIFEKSLLIMYFKDDYRMLITEIHHDNGNTSLWAFVTESPDFQFRLLIIETPWHFQIWVVEIKSRNFVLRVLRIRNNFDYGFPQQNQCIRQINNCKFWRERRFYV